MRYPQIELLLEHNIIIEEEADQFKDYFDETGLHM